MGQRSFSTLGGLLGIVTFVGIIGRAVNSDPTATWDESWSPLLLALIIALGGIAVLILSGTRAAVFVPIRMLGMWAFGVMVGSGVAAVILGLRGEWTLAWQMVVLGASGWLAQFLVGIPYRAVHDRAIS